MTQAWAIAEGVSKQFFATRALDDVTLHFHSGKVHAIAGENGAGKSTLMKLFGGLYQPDQGSILLGAKPVTLNSPRAAIQAGIVVIPQEMRVTPAQTVAENITLGDIPVTKRFGLLQCIDRRQMRERSQELLEHFAVSIDPDRSVSTLSFAERQIVMIARALNHKAKFLILDEPTAALETREIDRLFDVINSLKSLDVAIAFISHYLEEIQTIADTCSILRDGRVMHHSADDGVPPRDEIIRLMTGRDIEEVHGAGDRSKGEPLLTVETGSATNRQNVVTEVGLHCGEILGLAGLMGSGMTEFLQSVYGAGGPAKPAPKKIRLKNFDVQVSSPSHAIRQGIGLVPRERAQGLVMGMTVRENIVLPNLDKFSSLTGLKNSAAEEFVAELIEALDIRPREPDKPVRELSGGNQQKVIFARWLAGHIDILLLDEPTHGVDIGAKSQIHAMMDTFVAKGGGIIFASTEMTEILAVSDSVLAMRSGEFVARISRQGGDRGDYSEKVLRQALNS